MRAAGPRSWAAVAAADDMTVLVSVSYADGVAGVIREPDGEAWLTDDVVGGAATRLEDCRPGTQGTNGERTVLGGLMPTAAVAAQVVDDAGDRREAAAANGAWVIVLDQSPWGHVNPVCFVDAGGVPVAPRLPGDWPRSPVRDAAEQCPACGALAWDEVLPTDASRGESATAGGEMTPTPIVVCRRCGHEVSGGTSYATFERDDADPAQIERAVREAEQELRTQMRGALADVDFIIYGIDGQDAQVGGWGGGDRVSEVTVMHDGGDRSGSAASVRTDADDDGFESDAMLARDALELTLHEADVPAPTGSGAAVTIWLEARERERRRTAAGAEIRERILPVDGVPRAFTVAEVNGCWAAVRRHGGLTISVSAHGVSLDTIALRPVADPLDLWTADA